MEEAFVLFIALIVLTLLTAPIVFALVAWRRVRRLELRVRSLEQHRVASAPSKPVTQAPAPAPAQPVAQEDLPLEPEPPTAVPPVPAPAEELQPLTPPRPAPKPLRPVHEPVLAALAPSPAPRTGTSADPRPTARARLAKIDWERWVGLRGAAVLGAVFLGIAGILLFQYSVQNNLITPEMRVGMGIGAGVLGLVGGEVLRRKGYLLTSNGLAAGSVVVLYASFWAGHQVLALYAMKVAFVLMAAVTVLCCFLSLRNRSQLVAVLGLLGGFSTPLLLSSSLDSPAGLFGYILLLNLGFLFVGKRRGWSSIGLMGVLGTALIEFLWVGRKLDAEHVTFGLVVLAVFAVLFALSGTGDAKRKRGWFQSQASGVLLPFMLAGFFATRVELGPYLLPLAGLAAILSAAASWLARRERMPWLPLGAASGSVALIMVWLFSTVPLVEGVRAPVFVGVTLGLALLFHLMVEWLFRSKVAAEGSDDRAAQRTGHVSAAAFANGGMMLALIFAGVLVTGVSVWPWIVGLVGVLLVNVRLALKSGLAPLQLGGALALAIGLSCMHVARSVKGSFPSVEGYYAVLLAGGVLLGLLALRVRALNDASVETDRGARWAWIAAAAYALVVMPMLWITRAMYLTEPELVLGATLLLGLGAAFAASRARSVVLFAAAVIVTALFQVNWTGMRYEEVANADKLLIVLVALFATSAGFVAVPALFRSAFGESRWAHRIAAASVWLWYPSAQAYFDRHFGDGVSGLLPLLLAVPVGVASLALLRRGGEEDPVGATARAWYLGVAASFVCLALPVQIDESVAAIALCLFGLASAALWKRLGHAPLLVPSVLATAVGAGALCVHAVTPRAFERTDAVVFNLISYAYLLPAVATLAAAQLLVASTEARSRIEQGLPIVRSIAGFSVIALVFAWISLTIFNAWETGEWVVVTFRRMQTRDLVLSISWAVYALCLLGLGMGRRIGALRWVSLGLLLVTIGKVFLFDLGNLDGLHRVGSMFGLAMSLLLVSFLYQRFVFRAARTA